MDLLNYELRPMLPMVQHDWKRLTGSGEIRLINSQGLHHWTFNNEGEFECNNPYPGNGVVNAY